ncbi:RHS repeat-associated core domain-containing protein [Streptomyces sp. NPDC013313]|uniref:RHS repeat-associated core domain-containing protein n=1 Tax=Streptomyces sp. NPDC013313 TaxID=3155603 RepID=UPI0033DB97B8
MDVASETTATSTTQAEPDGTFTKTVSPLPVRVKRADGAWSDVDATLVKWADGSYAPKVATSELVLSGGGSGPLAILHQDGRAVSVSWPTSLPAPSVSDATATYANVLPDVDLVVTANGQGGFSEVLVIKSARAAANPALATLKLATKGDGVSLAADAAGNLSATDASGNTVFHAPAPVMWDTPAPSAQARTGLRAARAAEAADAGPESGAATAPVKVAVGGDGTLRLTPDAAMLASSKTHYPVYVDPSWQPVTESNPSFTYAQQAYPNTSHWNESGARLGVGYQGWSSPTGIERAFYQFDIKNVQDTDIKTATLNATEVYSSNNACTKYQVDVRSTAHISSATTWNQQPALYNESSSAQVGGANGAGCDGPVNFTADVTPAVATDGDGTLTLRLAGHSETDRLQFKRMSTNPTLSINYAPTPHDQGNIPWERYGKVRLDDSLVASPNLSNGDMVLNATDLDLSAVGQSLRLTRSASSFPMPAGALGSQWYASYERTLDTAASSKVTAYGPGGEALVFKQNSDGSYKNAAGYHAKLAKNDDGTWTLTHTQSGSKDTYNASGNLTAVTDRNGDKITVVQTLASGTVTGFKATDTRSGRWLSLTHGADAQHVSATDNSGRTVAYVTSGAVASGTAKMTVTDVTGGSTVFAYDTSGRVNQVTTPEGRVTKFGYDSQNRITSLQRVAPTGTDTWTYAYSATTRATAGTTKVTDPNAHTTTYTVDDSGQVTKVVDALTHTRSTSYDANHNQLTAVNAQGTGSQNTTTFGWDSSDNLTSAKLPTGATTALGAYSTHSGANLPSSLTTPSGKKTSYSYDTSGNLMSSQDTTAGVSNGAKLSYGYQGDDGVADCGGFDGQRCTATDAGGNKTSYSYDGQGNLSKTTPPSPLGATTYTYDTLGRPATVLDGRGVTTTYTYDNHDRVTKVATSGGSGNLTVGYTYDRDGNLLTQTDASGTLTFTYDGLGREATRTLADGAVYTQGYDPAGNLKTLTDPSGTVTYGYDDANRLTSLKDPVGATTTFTYDNDGNRLTTKLPGSVTQTATWDAANRPTSIKTTNGTSTAVSYNYSYKLAGADTDQIQSRTDNVSGKVITYTYDSQSRLNYAEEDSGSTRSASWLYCYDKAGNLTSYSDSADSCSDSGLTTYTYNAANQITAMNGDSSGWSYDKNGNELTGASSLGARIGETYNDFNQLTALTTAGTTHHYTYAGTNSSQRLTEDTTRVDQGPEGIAAITTDGVRKGIVRDPAGTLIGMTTDGAAHYYTTNNQGSPSTLTSPTGTVENTSDYGPTGSPRPSTTTTVAQPFGYTGAYLDTSGLYNMGARQYDRTTNRFTQVDPSGKETNAYLYTAGDPVNRTDPTGLWSLSGGLDVCYVVCLGGGYSKDDSGNSGWYLKIGVGNPGIGGGLEGSTGGADSGPSAYGGCAAGLGTIGGQLGGDNGSPSASLSAGLGTYASTPTCSGGLQIQF